MRVTRPRRQVQYLDAMVSPSNPDDEGPDAKLSKDFSALPGTSTRPPAAPPHDRTRPPAAPAAGRPGSRRAAGRGPAAASRAPSDPRVVNRRVHANIPSH